MVESKSLLEKLIVMKRHVITFLWAICFICISCTNEDCVQSVSTGDRQLRIVYRIADALPTRAPEVGWDEGWDENEITRIDLFVFSSGEGNPLHKHIPFPTLNVPNAQNETPLSTDKLTYNDVVTGDYLYYMVANCEQFATTDIENLADLKAMMIVPSLKFGEKVDAFVMDGKIDKEDKNQYNVNSEEKTATLTFNLSRAAVKIRMSVKDKMGTNLLNSCTYQIHNYVLTGTSVLSESEKYGEGGTEEQNNKQKRESMSGLGTVTLTKDDKVVFYSYPNDWFDESLLNNGVFENEEIYTMDNLIDEDKLTYILLKAPFTDEEGNTEDYYYKVPINYLIADYNDKLDFSVGEINKLRKDYYCMNRNHIYDITVTIDREGGPITEPVTPAFYVRINDWDFGNEYEIGVGEFE